MSLTGSVDPAAHPERLIPLDHPAVATLAEATAQTGVGACFGVAERWPGGAPYIAQVFAAAGQVAGVQRKRHLGAGEEAFTAATEPVVFSHAGTRFGVAICAESGPTARSTRPPRPVPAWCSSPPPPACTGGAPGNVPGGTGSAGGRGARGGRRWEGGPWGTAGGRGRGTPQGCGRRGGRGPGRGGEGWLAGRTPPGRRSCRCGRR